MGIINEYEEILIGNRKKISSNYFLFDKKGKDLFNYSKKGTGLKHWLKDMNLKSHNEIASKGKEFAKKNMWKVNLAQGAGIAYSAITLGFLLPMLNAKVTEHKSRKLVAW